MTELELLFIIYEYCIKIFIIEIYWLLFNKRLVRKTGRKGKNDLIMPFLSNSGELLIKKTILGQEKPREHSRSKT